MSDRKKLIRKAHAMPTGSPERRKLLRTLTAKSVHAPFNLWALNVTAEFPEIDPATLEWGKPAWRGSSVNIPFTAKRLKGRRGKGLVTMLFETIPRNKNDDPWLRKDGFKVSTFAAFG